MTTTLSPELTAQLSRIPDDHGLAICSAANDAARRIPAGSISPLMLAAARNMVYTTAIQLALFGYNLAHNSED